MRFTSIFRKNKEFFHKNEIWSKARGQSEFSDDNMLMRQFPGIADVEKFKFFFILSPKMLKINLFM